MQKGNLTDSILSVEGKNTRYTLINLIGLYKAEKNDYNISSKTKIDLKLILSNQINKLSKYESAGDIGLLLWATSLISPEEIHTIFPK